MNDDKFHEIEARLDKDEEVWLFLETGKYVGSVTRALGAKKCTTYYGDIGDPDRETYSYEDYKIKFKINGRNIWLRAWYLHESSQKYESIVTKSVDETKHISKDFLDREFNVGDVVFLHSPTFGEILGVINEISDKGTLTIRTAKKQNEWYTSERSKKGVFIVPHHRANRILIIDDPAVLLLRA